MSDQERRQILEMVVAGELTVEQAGELLERLDAESSANAEKQEDQRPVGFSRFTRGQIAHLLDYDIDEAYVQELERAGLGDLSMKQLIAWPTCISTHSSCRVSHTPARATRRTIAIAKWGAPAPESRASRTSH